MPEGLIRQRRRRTRRRRARRKKYNALKTLIILFDPRLLYFEH
jgi:hypothetical protein